MPRLLGDIASQKPIKNDTIKERPFTSLVFQLDLKKQSIPGDDSTSEATGVSDTPGAATESRLIRRSVHVPTIQTTTAW